MKDRDARDDDRDADRDADRPARDERDRDFEANGTNGDAAKGKLNKIPTNRTTQCTDRVTEEEIKEEAPPAAHDDLDTAE